MIDFDYGKFYGFVGTSIGYPIIFTKGSSGDGQYGAFIVGFGGTWKLSPKSAWQFDLGGTLTPTWWSGFSMGVGVSAGFHYTTQNGFTIGFKIPIFGVAPGCSGVFGNSYDDAGNPIAGCAKVRTGGELVANYYLQAGMSLPIVSLGYRF